MGTCFLSFVLLMRWITFIHLYVCPPGTDLIWLWCIIFLKYVAGFNQLIFVNNFCVLTSWDLFVCSFLSLWCLCWLWFQGNTGSRMNWKVFFFFEKYLWKIHISSLNIANSPVRPSKTELFFVGFLITNLVFCLFVCLPVLGLFRLCLFLSQFW